MGDDVVQSLYKVGKPAIILLDFLTIFTVASMLVQ